MKESPTFAASDCLKFFKNNIDDIRCNTKGSAEPVYLSSSGCHLNEFSLINLYDVVKVISATPNKQSLLVPCRTWLLKECINEVSPFITATCQCRLDKYHHH